MIPSAGGPAAPAASPRKSITTRAYATRSSSSLTTHPLLYPHAAKAKTAVPKTPTAAAALAFGVPTMGFSSAAAVAAEKAASTSVVEHEEDDEGDEETTKQPRKQEKPPAKSAAKPVASSKKSSR